VPLLTNLVQDGRLAMVAPWVRGHVLDLGCGHAPLMEHCGAAMTSYVGVDRSAELVADCARRHPGHRFLCLDLEEQPLGLGAAFDTVTMVALVEHVLNQDHLFQQARDSLRPGGRIVVTTPTPWGNDVVHRLGAALGLFSAEAARDHCVVYNRRRFDLLSARMGLDLLDYRTFQLGCNQRVVLAARGGR
jgi:SAM-dependent methyltransferase